MATHLDTLRKDELTEEEFDHLLAAALDSLAGVVPYDLATLFELEPDGAALVARSVQGPLAHEGLRHHRLPLEAFPTVARSLAARRPMILTEDHHAHGEGDPFAGLVDLPDGHSCMVVPIHARDRSLGLLTFDRGVCQAYPDEQVALAGVYGELLGLGLLLEDQARRLRRSLDSARRSAAAFKVEARGSTTALDRLETTRTPAMRALLAQVRQVATTVAPVLLTGETGTGKEVVAQALHDLSARSDRPFVRLNCAALPENLVESELFGHVKGAFSGADRARDGRFQAADGGTLLLDELGELPLDSQAKLLRVLQEGSFEPVGSDRTIQVDVRVIAATHRDLLEAVQEGRFREDLFYRLAVFPIPVPPLRARPQDIVPLAEALLAELHTRSGRGPWRLSPEAAAHLASRPWPGNVRQLRNVLERATILGESGALGVDVFEGGAPTAPVAPPSSKPAPEPATTRLPTQEESEREYFTQLLTATKGKISGTGGAAEVAQMNPSTLHSRLRKLGLRPQWFRPPRQF